MSRLSSSKIGLAWICGWAFQEGIPWTANDASNEASAIGNATHQCIDEFVTNFATDVAAVCASYKLTEDASRTVANLFSAWRLHYEHEDRNGWRTEVAFVFDPLNGSARQIGKSIGREYDKHGRRPHEIPCTTDEFHLSEEDGELVANVADWKSGMQRNLGAAADSDQLKFGVLCVARAFNCTRGRGTYARVTPSGVYTDTAEYDLFDIDEFAQGLKDLDRKIAMGGLTPKPGLHCSEKWCPAYGTSCPATVAAIGEVVKDDERHLPMVATKAAIQSKDHCRSIIIRLKAAEEFIKEAWKAVDEFADSAGPVPMGGGKAYAAKENEKETIVANPTAIQILRDNLGELAETVIETKVKATKTALEAATLAMVGKGRARTALERKILAELRGAGCVNDSKYTTHEVVKWAESEE